jgi:hypothetical protein
MYQTHPVFRPALASLCLLVSACNAGNDVPARQPALLAGVSTGADNALAGVTLAASETFAGVNGGACIASPYNCKLRVVGGNRIDTNTAGDETWGVDRGALLRDGNGTILGVSDSSSLKFNYGQLRTLSGTEHAIAMTTSNNSSAWFPVAAIGGATSFLSKVGHVSAKGAGLAKMACYAVRNSHDAGIELKKVVYDTTATHERAGDYLALVRANGLRSVNLVFNVPGFHLGGVAVDHFPAGEKFQRLAVPTSAGNPSITIPLWVRDSQGRYRSQSGSMMFVYGYFMGANSTPRNGWVALDALQTSSNCP